MSGKTVVRELREVSSQIRKSYDKAKWDSLLRDLERASQLGEQLSRSEVTLQAQRIYELIDRRLDSVHPTSFADVADDLDRLLGQIGHCVWTQTASSSLAQI